MLSFQGVVFCLFKRVLFLILFSLFIYPALAQQDAIDSIQKVLTTYTRNDTVKVNMLSELANNYQFFDADSMGNIARRGLELSRILQFKKGKADCYKQLGISYYLKTIYDSALLYNDTALGIYTKTDDKKGIAAILNNIAIIHANRGDFNHALSFYRQSLDLRKKIQDTKGVGATLNNMGNCYLELGNYDLSVTYLLAGLKIREQLDDKQNIAVSYTNIANVYHTLGKYKIALAYNQKGIKMNEELGNKQGLALAYINTGGNYFAMEDYTRAKLYFSKSLLLSEQIGYNGNVCVALSNLGEVCVLQKNYKLAEQYYKRALMLYVTSEDKAGVATCLMGLGNMYVKTGNTEQGIHYLREGIEDAEEIGTKSIVTEIAKQLSDIYEKKRDYASALKYYKIHSEYKDSLFSEKSNQKIQEVQFDYELDKKQKTIELLEKDKFIQQGKSEKQYLLSIVLALCLVLMLSVALVLYRSRQKEKDSKELILKQKQEIEKQANSLVELNMLKDKTFSVLSHDLRSPVASLSGVMMLMDEQILTPGEFDVLKGNLNRQLKGLSHLLDNLLFWAKSHMDGHSQPHRQSLFLQDVVEQNVSLLKEAATAKNISLTTSADKGLKVFADKDQTDIILRNLISNAVKFTPSNGVITISAKEETEHIVISVTDTGTGMTPEQIKNLFSNTSNTSSYGTEGEKGTGIGLLLCKEFVEQNGGNMYVTSEEGKGSTFSFTLFKSK